MIRLIINADDFGLTERINDAIVEGHRKGIVTSTTLMANGPAFDNAAERAKTERKLGIGIHLNLSEGTPLTDPSQLSCLINETGVFYLSPVQMLRKLMLPGMSLGKVEMELRAQIEKVLNAGIEVTHLDGHKHFHFLPQFLHIAIRLAQEYKIPAIRCAREWTSSLFRLAVRNWRASPTILKQYFTGNALSILAATMKRKVEAAGLKTPDYVLGIASTGFWDFHYLKDLIDRLPHGTSELICHPGYVDQHLLESPTRLLQQREIEMTALVYPEVKEWLLQRGVQLINYRNLCGGA
jgi:hopanoid biosynthesis associated protein HpnK